MPVQEKQGLQARMNHPVMIIPEAMPAMEAPGAAARKGGVPARTLQNGRTARQPDQRVQRLC